MLTLINCYVKRIFFAFFTIWVLSRPAWAPGGRDVCECSSTQWPLPLSVPPKTESPCPRNTNIRNSDSLLSIDCSLNDLFYYSYRRKHAHLCYKRAKIRSFFNKTRCGSLPWCLTNLHWILIIIYSVKIHFVKKWIFQYKCT